jgi:hypothetical protein
VVGDAEIESRSRGRGADLAGLAADLIQTARDRGGPDNITLVAARIEGPPPAAGPGTEPLEKSAPEAPPETGPSFRRTGFLVLSLIAAFALAVGAIFLLRTLSQEDEPPAREDLLEGVLKEVKGAPPGAPAAAPEEKKR